MILLLLVSLLTMLAFPPLGLAGLVAWFLLSVLFRVADEGVEQMATEIQEGNTVAGGCWLIVVFAFVILGGLAVLAVFGTMVR